MTCTYYGCPYPDNPLYNHNHPLDWEVDEEFGISTRPCEHPSLYGGKCMVCGEREL